MKFQNLSLHLKQIAATLAVGFVLVGCSKENENLSVSSSSQINSTSTISSTPSSTASSNLEQENQEETLDTEEFDYFDQAKKEIKELIESEQVEQAKEKGKEDFITGVDFIFYDKEMNGVTFDDFTEEDDSFVEKKSSVWLFIKILLVIILVVGIGILIFILINQL